MGRASATSATLRTAGASPTTSRGFLYLLDSDNRPSLYANVAAAFPLSFYDGLVTGFVGFEFPPGICAERVVLHYTSRAGDRESRDAALHSAGVHASRCHLSQCHYGMARDEPGGERLRGRPA